jgi:hypothetical protein
MDPIVVNPWLSLILSAVAVATVAKSWISSGEKQNTSDIAGLKKDLSAVTIRVQTIESDLRHLPDRDATHRLELALAEMNGQLKSMDERLKPVAAIGERLQEMLLQQVKK